MKRRALLLLAALCALSGCASVPRDPAARAVFVANDDPFEPFNRRVFRINQFLDRFLIKPLAEAYVHVVPKNGRLALRHFLNNLNEPIVFENTLLQARWRSAGITARRFVINSTLGIGGFGDPASRHKLPLQVGDFGQTLWRWGMRQGPYLIIPVWGPTTTRDGIGMGVDIYADPIRYSFHPPTYFSISRDALDGIDQRASAIDALNVLQRQSLDFYAAMRSLYLQNRAAELRADAASKTAPPAPLPSANFYDQPD